MKSISHLKSVSTLLIVILMIMSAISTPTFAARPDHLNNPPVIVEGNTLTIVTSDEPVTFTLNATDQEKSAMTWDVLPEPSKGTAVLSVWTNAKGMSQVNVTYDSYDGASGSDAFTVMVKDSLEAPTSIVIDVEIAAESTSAQWDDIRSYQCTYASDQLLDSSLLSGYDALILEPEAVSVQKLNEIRSQNPNAFLIGYFSIGETSALLKDSRGRPLDIYFLDKRGKPIQNPIWGSYYVDAGKPLWHQMVLEQYLPAIFARGYDGVFLDTVDTSANIQFVDSASGMSSLIKKINITFFDKLIVINRGFHLLLGNSNDVSGSIDGVMFESYSSTWYPEYHIYPEGESDYNWTESITNQLNSIRWQYNEDGSVKRVDGMPVKSSTYFNVLAHDYATSSQISIMQYCVDRAYSKAFVPSLGTMNLNEEPYDWQSLVVMPSESDWGIAIQ